MARRSADRFFSILFLILVVTIPILLHLSVFHSIAYNKAYYEFMFERHEVSVDNRTEANAQVISYLSGGDEPLVVMSDREIDHLSDVRERMRAAFFLLLFLLMLDVLLFVFLFRISREKRSLVTLVSLWSGVLTVLLSVVAGLGAVFFSRAFGVFHTVLFREGTWLFPKGSLLISLYPEAFFRETFVFIVAGASLLGVVSLFVGLLLRSRAHAKVHKRLFAVKKKKR